MHLLVSQGQTMAVVAEDDAAHRAIGRAALAQLLQSTIANRLKGSERTIGRVEALVDAVQNRVGGVEGQPRRVVRAALRHGYRAQLLDACVLAMSVVERRHSLGVGRDVDEAGRGEIAGAEEG